MKINSRRLKTLENVKQNKETFLSRKVKAKIIKKEGNSEFEDTYFYLVFLNTYYRLGINERCV